MWKGCPPTGDMEAYCYSTWPNFRADGSHNFTVWHHQALDICFEHIAFVFPSHALFALASAHYAGLQNGKFKRNWFPSILAIRLVLSLVLLLASLTDLTTLFWLANSYSPAQLLSLGATALAWLTHSVYIVTIGRSVLFRDRGPLVLNFSWYLTFVSVVVVFRHQLQYLGDSTSVYAYEAFYFGIVTRATTFVTIACQILYCLSLLFPVKQVVKISEVDLPTSPLLWNGLTLNYDRSELDNSSETAPLLLTSTGSLSSPFDHHFRESYGSVSVRRKHRSRREAGKSGAAEDNANFVSKLTFWWLQPLMSTGARGELRRVQDLPLLPHLLQTPVVRETFQKVWNKVHRKCYHDDADGLVAGSKQQQCANGVPHPSQDPSATPTASHSTRNIDLTGNKGRNIPLRGMSLFWSLNRAFGCSYYSLALLKLLVNALSFAGPILLQYLVGFMEERREPIWHGYAYAIGMVCGVFLNAFFRAHYSYQLAKANLRFRAATVTLLYHKSLQVNLATLSKFSTGEVANFMSTDTDRIANYTNSFHEFWSLPLQIVVALVLLYQQVGLSFLGGVAIAVLLIPVNRWLAKKIGKLTEDMMAHKDSRVKTITEVLFGVRIVKLCAWEDIFARTINQFRKLELKSLMYRKYLDAGCVYFWATTPIIISIVTFVTYSLLGNQLTASKVFTSLSLFSILLGPLNAYPWVINGLVEAWVSLKRVQAFLNLEETDPTDYYRTCPSDPSHVVEIKDGCFTWVADGSSTCSPEGSSCLEDTTPRPEQLLRLSLAAGQGQLVGVVGRVGSGKTSVIAALTAEMQRKAGAVFVSGHEGGLGLVTQKSWIQHATVRDNILFGREFDPERYNAVIQACALEPDLCVLPAGDQTEVGENGVTLSGGQKMRIALARAVYQDKSIYIMDDPFAAVDAHVASHIFDTCVNGLLREKTRILCTHHVRFLSRADVVVVLEGGRVKECGPPEVVLPHLPHQSSSEEESGSPKSEGKEDKNGRRSEKEGASLEAALCSSGEGAGTLVKEEEREVDAVKLHVYWSYIKAVGYVLAAAIGLFLFLMEASKDVTNWWLAYWVSTFRYHGDNPMNISAFNITSAHFYLDHENYRFPAFNITESGSNKYFYIGIYLGLAAANSVFTLFRAFLFAYGGICATTILHKKLLHKVLRAPVSFFDTNPIGRIINRFSSDVFTIDDSLPFQLNIFLAQVFGLLGTLTVVCYGLPWVTLLLVPLAMIYYKIQHYYRRTSRELKRLSAVTLSPIYAHFTETLTGLQVIRAFRHSQRFARENEERLEVNQRAFYACYAVSYWLSLRLQMIGVFIISAAAFIAVLEHHFSFIDPGLVGLAISYSLAINSLISQVVVSFSETEKEMVSVERAVQYIERIPAESNQGELQAPPTWPQTGCIEFHRVVLIYRPGLPPALREVSFTIRGGEKVGVVGRTGAGKSSLFQALFRTVEVASGAVLLDGIDIARVALRQLRLSMAIIPQDPFLFSGSVRSNIDPGKKHTDEELWSALHRSHLTSTIQALGGLDVELGESGRELSAGQQQLLCLARALTSNARVICFDEATASVDMETDALIQQTLAVEFTGSTVLTIAHRIDTVMSCDRILVMDQGRVSEYDTPQNLLRDSQSLFHSMVKESKL